MRLRSRPRSRRVGTGVGGGEGSEGSSTYHNTHHTTLPRPASHPTTPLAPRSQTPFRRDGRPDSSAQNRKLDSFLPTTRVDVLCKEPRHATSRYPPSLLLYDGTQREEVQHGHRRALPLACDSRHITSINQSLNQSLSHSTNELYIQCIHCRIPSTHASSAVQCCSHTPSM
jgi:hypothetical protein